MSKIIPFTEVILQCRKVHGDKYNYVEESYKGVKFTMDIICPIHGKFTQNVYKHIKMSHGCPECGKIKSISKNIHRETKTNSHKISFEEFKAKAIEKYGDKFVYDEKSFKNMSTHMRIYCKEKDINGKVHGWFEQTPKQHLRTKFGCKKCADKYNALRQNYTFEIFVKKSNDIHGDTYSYNKNYGYHGCSVKIPIYCKKHGEFWQTPNEHLQGYGCPICGHKKAGLYRRMKVEEFIEKAKIVHGIKYNYENIKQLETLRSYIYPICPKHGSFKIIAQYHLDGIGCPLCNESKLENQVRSVLEKKNIKYVYEQKFEWLKYNAPMSLDFYLPDYNVAIECQGEQHFRPVNFGGCSKEEAEINFNKILNRDKFKKTLCEKHNIPIFYVNYDDIINEKCNEIIEVITYAK